MPLTFNTLLRDAGLDPGHVRLLRHETRRHGRTPYSLWRDDLVRFDDYQRIQKRSRSGYFASPYWASFVVTPSGKTLFASISVIGSTVDIPADWIDPISGRNTAALADYDLYDLVHSDALADYAGRLVIDWGTGARTWAQRAERQDKTIVELWERFVAPSFPGYVTFIAQLSDIEALPQDWRTALQAARGIYLLTCPSTKEQYVGSACGEGGFMGRWLEYAATGHGGNVGLRMREPANYRVSILQVAGSGDDREAILAMEVLWKQKLQSRDMGLNRN